MTNFLRRVSRDAHQISKFSGDAAAFQTGGAPRLAKRVARRIVTRSIFQLARKAFR